VPEDELTGRAFLIQDRTQALIDRASVALVDMLGAITAARAAGASDHDLVPALDLQRKAQFRLDFVYSENSRGFHAAQESARILAESIDFARQAQVAAQTIRTPAAPGGRPEPEPVLGVTPAEAAPPGPDKSEKP
jgi:nitrite reductase (cytochrome c-552)